MGLNCKLVVPVLILMGPMCCTSEVKEKTSSYSCCGSARIQYDPTCEHTWTADDWTFAHTKDDTKECAPPCKEIGRDWIVLDSCRPVNVTTICNTAKDGTEETIMSYLGIECQYSGMKPGSQCESGLMKLLVLLIIGQLLKWMAQ